MVQDFSYHFWSINKQYSDLKISDFNPIINRGKNSKKELHESNIDFIHTSDLSFGFRKGRFKTVSKLSSQYRYAIKGDILIPRVGKRCLNKVLLVEKGNIPVSDCIYIIRIENKDQRNRLLKSLTSKKGRDWIEAHSHGVCAKVISKRDLLEYKI